MLFRRTSECRVRSCPISLRDGVSMNSLNRQCVVSHLVFQVPTGHALLVFPCERHWLVDWLVQRKGGGIVVAFVLALAVTMLCSVCWLSAAARWKARHRLFMRMSGGIIPLTTGSMKVGVNRMHPDTSRRPLFRAAPSRCVWAVVLNREYRINVLYTLFV